MKRVLLALLLISALIFTSCDAFIDTSTMAKPKLYFVGIGLDYRTWNRRTEGATTPGKSYLGNTRNDLEAMTAQVEHLAQKAGYEYRIVTYDDFDSYYNEEAGKREQFPTGANYDFMFRTWSNNGGKEAAEEKEFLGQNIAGPSTTLRQFAEQFIEELTKFLELDGKPSKNDIILFYYTGHGLDNGLGPALYYQTGDHSEKELREGIPMPASSKKVGSNDYIIPVPYLYLDELFFDQYEATTVTMFDCCYSGHAVDNSQLGSIHNFKTNSWNNGTVRDDELQVPSLESIFKNTYYATFGKADGPENRYHLTAAHATQTSFDKDMNPTLEKQDKFGAFTYQILDYLDYNFNGEGIGTVGDPEKRIYSVSDLYTHIFNNIGYQTKTYATPNVTRSRFDFAFFMMH